MSKNLTRKSLAFGALIALGSSVIAGSPALAAGEINLVPSSGTSYNALAGTVYNLKATFAPGSTPSSYAQLKYVVTTGADSAVTYTLGTSLVTSASTSVAASTTAVTAATSGADATTVNYIGLAATTTSVTSTVSVTAFVDANNDNALTAGEWNTIRTVTFKKVADVTPVVTITTPAVGDTSAKATVNWGDLNIEQISRSGAFGVANGSANKSLGLDIKVNAGSYAAATYSEGTFTLGSLNIVAGDVVTAQAVYASNPYTGSANSYSVTALGTAATATASARTINTNNGLVSNVLKSTDAVATAATTIATNTAATVRTNGSFTAQVKATDISAGATSASTVAKSGVAVVATLTTSATLSATAGSVVSITANGTTYNTAAALSAASIALTTDSNGLASVALSTAGFVDGQTVTVTFKAQNLTSAVVATADDATYTVVSKGVGSALRSIVEGGSTTFTYAVKDQYGVAFGSGGRLKFDVGYTVGATSYVNLVNGEASITVTDTTASTDVDITVDATLQKQDAATGNWALLSPSVTATQQTVNVTATAVAFDTAPVAQSIALSTSVALTTSSVNNPGAAVTIASKGVTFIVGGVEYADTVTLFSAANGDVVVNALSNIAGEHTITYTAGADVKTAVVTVAAAAANSGATLSITAPTIIKSGRTLIVTAKLVDKYGNPVAVPNTNGTSPTTSLSYEGPGFVTSAITQTLDASGVSTFRVLLGAGDTGAANVTFTYDADGTTATVAKVTKTATVLIGVSASVSKAATSKVTVKNAEGLTVKVVRGTKSVTKVATSDSYKVSLKGGSGTVKVYVEGILVASKK